MVDKIAQKNRTIQNSIEFKASAYVLHDIRQVAALVDLSRINTRTWRQEILNIRQHLILPLFGGGLHMCICCCMCVVYVCAYVREKVMFEVYGSESKTFE